MWSEGRQIHFLEIKQLLVGISISWFLVSKGVIRMTLKNKKSCVLYYGVICSLHFSCACVILRQKELLTEVRTLALKNEIF